MRIAVYGGSFNPPHLGHVAAARAAIEALRPDRLLVMPTNTPPHKQLERNSPSPAERLKLCRLAFGEIPGAEVSDMEMMETPETVPSGAMPTTMSISPPKPEGVTSTTYPPSAPT